MSTLKDIWDHATRFVANEIKWAKQSIHPRQEGFRIDRNDGYPSFYYTPPGVPADDWQKLLRDKIGGEVQHPYDIFKAHNAYCSALCDLTRTMSVRQAMEKMSEKDFHVMAFESEFRLNVDAILYPDKAGLAPREY